MTTGARCAARPGLALPGWLMRCLKSLLLLLLRNYLSPLRLLVVREGVLRCNVVHRSRGRPPNPPSPLRSASPLRFVVFCAWACFGGSCCRTHNSTGVRRFTPAAPREQPHRVVVLGDWPAASFAGARPAECSTLPSKRFSLVRATALCRGLCLWRRPLALGKAPYLQGGPDPRKPTLSN
jgi:hypothetical protein